MTTQREIWDSWKAPETLYENVKLFFELLDKKEESSNGVEFHPNRFNAEDRVIDSCRVWDTHRLKRILKKMRELSHPDLDPIQNNCKYGYVLPDRCRYNSITGCDCGAYPPVRKDDVRGE